jgi:hypothetical protein
MAEDDIFDKALEDDAENRANARVVAIITGLAGLGGAMASGRMARLMRKATGKKKKALLSGIRGSTAFSTGAAGITGLSGAYGFGVDKQRTRRK